ncbi:MAG: hypothetical protein QW524_01795 [Candidatus Woesearchaeota archaeon]
MLFYWGYLRERAYEYNAYFDSKTGQFFYEGHHLLGSDYKFYKNKIDNGVFLDDLSAVYVNFDESVHLKNIYSRSLKKIYNPKSLRKLSELEKIKIFSEELKKELKKAYKGSNNLTNNMQFLFFLPIDFYFRHGPFVCKHYASAMGCLLEKAINEGVLNGDLSLETNYLVTDSIQGHAWIRYKNNHGTFIIDLANNKIQSLEKNIENEKRIEKKENLENKLKRLDVEVVEKILKYEYWDYKRPEESREFREYYEFIDFLRDKGYQVIRRFSPIKSRIYVNPWSNFGIYVDDHVLLKRIHSIISSKEYKNTLELLKDLFTTFNNVLAVSFYNPMEHKNKNLNVKFQIHNDQELEKKEYSLKARGFLNHDSFYVVKLSDLINAGIITLESYYLMLSSILETLKKDKKFKNLLRGDIVIERDDVTRYRGYCFMRIFDNKRYVIDLMADCCSIENNKKLPHWILTNEY